MFNAYSQIVEFSPILLDGKMVRPQFGDRMAILLFKHITERKVSLIRAFRGYKASGAKEEKEIGEGRAFLRWLKKHDISIEWRKRDFTIHPLLNSKNSPHHDPEDEWARDMSFAIRPVVVEGRKVKLYLQDNDVLALLNLNYGEEESFLDLVSRYVELRFKWEDWRAPAPCFLDWVKSQAKRPVLHEGQIGWDLKEHQSSMQR